MTNEQFNQVLIDWYDDWKAKMDILLENLDKAVESQKQVASCLENDIELRKKLCKMLEPIIIKGVEFKDATQDEMDEKLSLYND